MSPQKTSGGKSILPFIIIGGVLVAVVTAGVLTLRKGDSKTSTANYAAPSSGSGAALPNAATRREAAPGAQPPHIKGRQTAPVVLEEFGDYQCPPCGAMHPVLQKIEDDYSDRVALIFRNFPLQKIHKNAFSASRAAEAAAAQGKFWEMHDMIYKNQKEWSDSPEPRPLFENYARRLELNIDKFKADMEKQETAARIIADFQRGDSMGVTGTPSIFLNGRQLPVDASLSDPKLRAEIDAALASKK